MTENTRDAKGRLLPGANLNSAGRPKGAVRVSEASKLHTLIEPHREQLVARLAEIAKGNGSEAVKAAEILLGYLAAKPRPTAELVHVPDLAAADGLEAKCAVVINAVANGEITSTAARDLLAVISDLSKIIEITDLEDRLRVIEGRKPRRIAATAKPAVERTDEELV